MVAKLQDEDHHRRCGGRPHLRHRHPHRHHRRQKVIVDMLMKADGRFKSIVVGVTHYFAVYYRGCRVAEDNQL